MNFQQSRTIKVILSEADIRKIMLMSKPNSAEDMIGFIKSTPTILQFYSLRAITNFVISNIFQNSLKTLEVIPVSNLIPVTSNGSARDKPSTEDTELLSSSSQ